MKGFYTLLVFLIAPFTLLFISAQDYKILQGSAKVYSANGDLLESHDADNEGFLYVSEGEDIGEYTYEYKIEIRLPETDPLVAYVSPRMIGYYESGEKYFYSYGHIYDSRVELTVEQYTDWSMESIFLGKCDSFKITLKMKVVKSINPKDIGQYVNSEFTLKKIEKKY
jgi:hypothetical protein